MINIIEVFFVLTFAKTLPIKAKVRNAYSRARFNQCIWKISVAWTVRSGFQVIYTGTWWHSLETNKSIAGLQICRMTIRLNLGNFEMPNLLECSISQAGIIIIIPWSEANAQISFEESTVVNGNIFENINNVRFKIFNCNTFIQNLDAWKKRKLQWPGPPNQTNRHPRNFSIQSETVLYFLPKNNSPKEKRYFCVCLKEPVF